MEHPGNEGVAVSERSDRKRCERLHSDTDAIGTELAEALRRHLDGECPRGALFDLCPWPHDDDDTDAETTGGG